MDRVLKAVIRQLADQRGCPVEHIEHYIEKSLAKSRALGKSGEMTLEEVDCECAKELKDDLKRYLGMKG